MSPPHAREQPLTPDSALACITATTCPKTRSQFSISYGQRWGREEINAACSALQSTQKQLIYNELWG